MATEKCKLCKIDSTPWEMMPELNGHICSQCSYDLCSLETEFDHYKHRSVRVVRDLDLLKRMTRLIITKWSK